MTNESSLGEDLFRARRIEAVNLPGANQAPIGLHGVDACAGPTANRGDGGPLGHKLVAGVNPGAAKDRTGDDPLDGIGVGSIGGGDDYRAGILQTGGVDSVHGVGSGEAVAGVPTNSEITGKGASVEHRQERPDSQDPAGPFHSHNPIVDEDERLAVPGWVKASGLVFGLFILAAVAFAIFEPIQVLPRIRLAPGYSLMAQDGSMATSESARGVVTLYTFAPIDCGQECAAINETMQEVRDRVPAETNLGGTDFRLITISLNPVTSNTELAEAAAVSEADGTVWQWVGGSGAEIRTIVGSGFQRFYETSPQGVVRFDPGYILVDGAGVVRGEYRYQTLAADGDKIVNHIAVLGDEIRNATGATAVAYEAAHLFLCYP